MDMKANLRVFISSIFLQMRQSFGRSMFRFCMIAYPILYGFTLYMIYMDSSNETIINYVMFGTAIASLWGTISFSSAGDIDRERFMGSLEVIFNSPTNFFLIMFGKIVGNTILGTLSMFVSILFVSIGFSIPIIIVDLSKFILVFIIGLFSFIGIAMMLSGLLAVSRSTRIFMNILDYPMMILSGVAFPISLLPSSLIPISYSLAPTHFLLLIRMCISGIDNLHLFYIHLGYLIGLTTIYGILSYFLYRIIDIKAREKATLGMI